MIRKSGSPTVVTAMRLDPRVHELVKEIAFKEDRSLAEQVQYILKAWLVGNGHMEAW